MIDTWCVIMMAERTALDKPQVRDGQHSRWLVILQAPLRLLANLLG